MRSSGRVQLRLTEFAEGLDLGIASWGTAQGNAAELADRFRDLDERGYRVVVSARGHGSLERARRWSVTSASTRSNRRWPSGFVFEAGEAGPGHRGGPLRLAPAYPDRTTVHTPAHRFDRRRAGTGRLRRPPDPRRGPVRGHHPPRARGRRTRLPDPGVRAGRQAVRALGPGGHGGEVHRRRRATSAPHGWQRLGACHHQGQARRQGHGGRTRAPLHGAHVGAGSCLRARYAVAAGAGGRVPARGDRRIRSPRSTR